MNSTVALIELHRSNSRSAAKSGDMERASLFARIVVGMRITTGEIPVKLKPAARLIARSRDLAGVPELGATP